MAARPPEHLESKAQPQPATSPIAIPFGFPNAKKSHLKHFSAQGIDISPENEIYKDQGRPKANIAKPRSGRNGEIDYTLGSMNSWKAGNEEAELPIISNGSSYDGSDELNKHHPQPREDELLVRHDLGESHPPKKSVSIEPPALSRSPSNLESLSTSQSSSSLKLLPPPRPPPGPGPGPDAKPALQIFEHHEASTVGRLLSPSVKIAEPDQPPSTGRLFPLFQNAQELQPRSRNRQPWRRKSAVEILGKIRVIRTEVWRLRADIVERRNALREKQEEKSIADDAFMKYIRAAGLRKRSRKDKIEEKDTIRNLRERCEALRNDYGPLEDDCNLLENVLNNREYEMQKLEASLEEALNEAEPPFQQEAIYPPVRSPPASEHSESVFSQNFHPLVSEFLSKLGDVEIFRERLDWHVDEKLTLEEEKERLRRVGKSLAEADQHWLDNYAEAEAGLKQQLQEEEEEAEKLRMLCYSRGLVDEDGEPLPFEEQERKTFIAEEVDPGSEISDFVKFPRLLHNPGSKEDLLPDPQLPPDDIKPEEIFEKTQDPSDRINSWLLQTLRSSPLDVNLLFRTCQDIGLVLEGEKWQFHVLMFWYHDGSKEMAAHYSRSLSEVVTHSRQKTGGQQTTFSGRHSLGMVIRGSRLDTSKPEEKTVEKLNGLLLQSQTIVKNDEEKNI
ncbi:hypothetical protein NA56DRAFT_645877 [Hyaloscypha hepaticicola]|uniref:Uncharacterized protein n=1 Tax=Hyaloscypha hepaticicola TaxID=2082293 RepID=A0A2J6Q4F8_9HELO|nr:hypothetical protein NA56DRAFT_645877 [Hyaloscypha hepaticicola]